MTKATDRKDQILQGLAEVDEGRIVPLTPAAAMSETVEDGAMQLFATELAKDDVVELAELFGEELHYEADQEAEEVPTEIAALQRALLNLMADPTSHDVVNSLSDAGEAVRVYETAPYIIAYVVDGKKVIILRIFDER